tara:strand:+ start:5285 stop:6322 length:1038 start_codon:yes stop_codon:yes gene_type:complete
MRFICAFTVGFILIILLQSGFFMITEGSAVVITQFGQIIGDPYTKAGLYLKVPYIWKANYLDSRIHSDEETQPGIATKDGYFIAMDTFFFWRIDDFDKYISTVDDIKQARILLRNIVSGSVRQHVSKRNILDTIQTEHPVVDSKSVSIDEYQQFTDEDALVASSDLIFKKNKDGKYTGRNQLTKTILKDVNKQAKSIGVVIETFMISNVEYTKNVQQLMYDRMIAERLREAAKIHATGVAEVSRIKGLESKTLDGILAPARKQALLILGQAEAHAAKISSKAFNKNRVFYNYWKSLTNYSKLFSNKNSTMLLSTDTPYLDFIGNSKKTISRSNSNQSVKITKDAR